MRSMIRCRRSTCISWIRAVSVDGRTKRWSAWSLAGPPSPPPKRTVVAPRSDIKVEQPEARMFVFHAGVNLDEIVRAVNQVGAAPGDLVAILEALKEAGALRAELIVI